MLNKRFITFEGGEGSGKTTQIALLSDYLVSKSYQVHVTREPGGSKGAENIRNLLVTGNPDKWDPETEALLMYAARRDNYIRIIRPNLNEGKIVAFNAWSLIRKKDVRRTESGEGIPLEE